ncbi:MULTISPECIES: acyltransferase [Halomicrobium]|uniref:Transferase hexapeptide repeat containing protein n=2 Tax=Halomicrobium mukohataei TaxID=57705 RepID=C7P1I3_HALMD|nr:MULTISPECIES: acyltransferase [Halomicrobium]ACV47191.1 transferase hexapeptide repeat containing protein [Halomicrobium mukohataei DSM 12286]QCD65667.1 acyltransferase [Halomicrobium mukohataei]QFR20473.1 acyltransferase [Halomicrobium sp. ZPS1]
MTKRHVSLPPLAEEGLRAFISEVDERLASDEDTCDVVEDVLVDLHGDREAYERWQSGEDVSPAERVRLQGYDPCNATLESEYYAEKDEDAFSESKYLQWLWRQFDATPMADNVEFALRFRRMIAEHLFEEVGDGCRFFKGITFTYGHNITVGDNVVIHDDVHLDDRGRLTIGDRVSISDDAHVYTHDHDSVDQTHVDNYHTIIEDDARVTYDSMVRAGVRLGENSILAAKSSVSRDVPAHHIAAGTPAESVAIKDGWESVADSLDGANVDRRDQRKLDSTVPDDVTQFDEFGRDLSPPDR